MNWIKHFAQASYYEQGNERLYIIRSRFDRDTYVVVRDIADTLVDCDFLTKNELKTIFNINLDGV